MGFLIAIGPLTKEKEVFIDTKTWKNSVSLSYSCADEFAKHHKEFWMAIRKGDLESGDPVQVLLTAHLVQLILQMPETDPITRQLKSVVQYAYANYFGLLYICSR
jgi:hypothetical protein